jgi:phosphoribosylamine-glycine ligase
VDGEASANNRTTGEGTAVVDRDRRSSAVSTCSCHGQKAALFVVDNQERVSDSEEGPAVGGMFGGGCHAVIFSTAWFHAVAAWSEIMRR